MQAFADQLGKAAALGAGRPALGAGLPALGAGLLTPPAAAKATSTPSPAVKEPTGTWPLSQDYNEAIQDPPTSFGDPELRGGTPVLNALGMPMPRSGNFADVYEFNCPATQTKWAIKCFTRQVAGQRERYSEISRYLQTTRLPFAVEFQYLEQGIRIRGAVVSRS